MVALFIAAVTFVASTACASMDVDGEAQADLASPSSTGAVDGSPGSPATGPSATGTVVVTITSQPGRMEIAYEEGWVPDIRLVSSGGAVIEPLAQNRRMVRFAAVAAGDYSLRAAQRPCEGNCAYLDPPTNRCRGAVAVTSETRASVAFVDGVRCTVSW